MPYRRTGRPNGRPPRYPVTHTIAQLETAAGSLRQQARRRQDAADQKIARLLATGKTRREVAEEIGKSVNHVRYAVERHRKRMEIQA